MTYSGASVAAQSRQLLGKVLESLQRDPNVPKDVLSVAENIAHAVGALFEAERASSEVDGKASVRHAMGSLSQTMALLQDLRGKHDAIEPATRTLADVLSKLYPLSQAPTLRPGRTSQQVAPPVPPEAAAAAKGGGRATAPSASAKGGAPAATPPPPPPVERVTRPGEREQLEANVGATTESNFFVGFSGDISEGGVFVATYLSLPIKAKVDVLVTLPGGFHKSIPGTVRFVRDPMDMDSEPGIGVRFDRLDEEARELILRFIRKRPPLFYDE